MALAIRVHKKKKFSKALLMFLLLLARLIIVDFDYLKFHCVATVALGLRPRQGFIRVWDKREARKAHFILPGVHESVRK
jgi:hypothetical protein